MGKKKCGKQKYGKQNEKNNNSDRLNRKFGFELSKYDLKVIIFTNM